MDVRDGRIDLRTFRHEEEREDIHDAEERQDPADKPQDERHAVHAPSIGETEAAYWNRCTNCNAVSATSRQPWSIVSECPRPGISTISVALFVFRFCF